MIPIAVVLGLLVGVLGTGVLLGAAMIISDLCRRAFTWHRCRKIERFVIRGGQFPDVLDPGFKKMFHEHYEDTTP